MPEAPMLEPCSRDDAHPAEVVDQVGGRAERPVLSPGLAVEDLARLEGEADVVCEEGAGATVVEVEGEPLRSEAHPRPDLRSWGTWCRCDQLRH